MTRKPAGRTLKAHHTSHQTFTDATELEQAAYAAANQITHERLAAPLDKPRISA